MLSDRKGKFIYDITHGKGLAIITPRWIKHILCEEIVDRFVNTVQMRSS